MLLVVGDLENRSLSSPIVVGVKTVHEVVGVYTRHRNTEELQKLMCLDSEPFVSRIVKYMGMDRTALVNRVMIEKVITRAVPHKAQKNVASDKIGGVLHGLGLLFTGWHVVATGDAETLDAMARLSRTVIQSSFC